MEVPVAIVRVEGEGEIAFFTSNGMVKRSTEKDTVVSKAFYQAIKLSEGDKLIAAEHEIKGKSFVMFSKNGCCVNFEKSEVPVQGRVSGGVKGMNLDDGDSIAYAGQNINPEVVVVSANGYVKKLDALQIPISARNRKGLKFVNFAEGAKQVAFVGCASKFAVDFGLKFSLLETRKIALAERLNAGTKFVNEKFLGIYCFEE